MKQPPKEKAIELRDKHAKFQTYTVGFNADSHAEFVRLQRAKQCALIDVKNTIDYAKTFGDTTDKDVRYFTDVINELEQL